VAAVRPSVTHVHPFSVQLVLGVRVHVVHQHEHEHHYQADFSEYQKRDGMTIFVHHYPTNHPTNAETKTNMHTIEDSVQYVARLALLPDVRYDG